jgi:hypothetical protein
MLRPMDFQPFLSPDPDLPGHDPIGEEIALDLGLNPNEPGIRDAFLKARMLLIRGLIEPDAVLAKTLQLQRRALGVDEGQ